MSSPPEGNNNTEYAQVAAEGGIGEIHVAKNQSCSNKMLLTYGTREVATLEFLQKNYLECLELGWEWTSFQFSAQEEV